MRLTHVYLTVPSIYIYKMPSMSLVTEKEHVSNAED